MSLYDTNSGKINTIPVIDLSKAPGERSAWDKPKLIVYLWGAAELIFISNPWQISSKLRVSVLRLFGAKIGRDVVYRPRTRVKFPWKLHIGDRSWIGEGVWFHNQDHLYIGDDVAISQETLVTTGSHAFRSDMALICRPIIIETGSWITARCIILGGTRIGSSAVISPGSVIGPNEIVEANTITNNCHSKSTAKRFQADIIKTTDETRIDK
ncbi:acetyltransferase [Arthrobacter sp. E3]|uniref:acetyltransferase n=1 Tax=Arthrobacter sp. E3 TaxID=517402 RepID=UPI001A93CBB5|nr:acetyltransferase [Arthrobacter sp. E3]